MKKLFIYIFITTSLATRGIALAEPVTVYAAASLTSALQDLSKTAEKQGISLRMSFAGSSILAKQIAQGAPADIYFSANVKWMDFLATEKLLEPNTRINLLGNALVIIAPKMKNSISNPTRTSTSPAHSMDNWPWATHLTCLRVSTL